MIQGPNYRGVPCTDQFAVINVALMPAPIFWGVLAAWIPVPPSLMAGLLCAAMVYALLNYLIGLREWTVEEEPVLLA